MVFRELSFSRLECGVHDRLHIYPLCGVFYFPWHRHQIEGTNGFYCLIRKTERFTISNVESQVFTPNNSRLPRGLNAGGPRPKRVSYHWTTAPLYSAVQYPVTFLLGPLILIVQQRWSYSCNSSLFWRQTHNFYRWVPSNEHLYIGTMQHVNWNTLPFTLYEIKRSQQHKPQCTSASRMRANHPVDSMMHCEAEGDEAMRWTMRRCDGRWGDAMDDEAMLWGDAMGLCYHRPIASPHRPSHRLIVHRIASSSIASPHRPSHRPIASPHRPSHRLIVHRIASSSIASPHRPSRRRNASVSLLGHHSFRISPSCHWSGQGARLHNHVMKTQFEHCTYDFEILIIGQFHGKGCFFCKWKLLRIGPTYSVFTYIGVGVLYPSIGLIHWYQRPNMEQTHPPNYCHSQPYPCIRQTQSLLMPSTYG